MKLLQDNKALHAEEFANSSPYIIMFGPDKCGATNKVRGVLCSEKAQSNSYRFTSSSATRTPRLASTRRSTSRTRRWLASLRPPRFTPSS
jgi:calnexin